GQKNSLECAAEAGWFGPGMPASIPAGNGTMGGYTMSVSEPVLSPVLRGELRFRVPEAFLAAGARSSVSVAIKTADRVFGILAVFSLGGRVFSPQEINFV